MAFNFGGGTSGGSGFGSSAFGNSTTGGKFLCVPLLSRYLQLRLLSIRLRRHIRFWQQYTSYYWWLRHVYEQCWWQWLWRYAAQLSPRPSPSYLHSRNSSSLTRARALSGRANLAAFDCISTCLCSNLSQFCLHKIAR